MSCSAGFASLACLPMLPDRARAQEAPAATGADRYLVLEEVVVTGSRLQGYVANTPIYTLSGESLKNAGSLPTEGVLNQLPQFMPSKTAFSEGAADTGIATIDLRGLGPSRNLVLLDGRRMQPSGSTQVVDVNTIPTALIEGVEIITGGASAVYGSDAVAGVVNFKTKRDFSGVALDVQTGWTQEGGGGTKDVTLAAGGPFNGGTGHAVVAISYSERQSIAHYDRSFAQLFPGANAYYAEGAYIPSGTNAPSAAAVNSLFTSYGSAVPNRFLGFGINPDGTLFSQGLSNNQAINYRGTLNLPFPLLGALVYHPKYGDLEAPLTRYSGFAKADEDITDHINAYSQLTFASYTDTTQNDAPTLSTLTVPATNPFIPSNLGTLLASRANPTAPFTLSKRFYEFGPSDVDHGHETYQVLGGFRGDLGSAWRYDIYGSHGEDRSTDTYRDAVFGNRIQAALSAPDGGASLCAGGYNPFGLTTLSAACQSYFSGSVSNLTTTTQDVVEGTLNGNLFTLPGGDVKASLGLDYRRNGYKFVPDQQYVQGNVAQGAQTGGTAGATDAKEVFTEIMVPLLLDQRFAKALSVDLAYRYSNYNFSGGVNSYKGDLNWVPGSMIRFRGGYERAVRAPNVGELFTAPTAGIQTIGQPPTGGDPCDSRQTALRSGANAAAIQALCVAQGLPAAAYATYQYPAANVQAITAGNTALKPETANTYTVGTILTPQFSAPLLSHFNVSVDYYNVTLLNAIGTSLVSDNLTKCFDLDGVSNPTYSSTSFYCQQIKRDANGNIYNTLIPTLNLGAIKTSGIDIDLTWKADLESFHLPASSGSIGLTTAVNRLYTYKTQTLPGSPFVEYAGTLMTNAQAGFWPRYKADTTLSYDRKSIGAFLKWRYIGAMDDSTKVTTPNNAKPGVPSTSYFDFGASWTHGSYTLRGSVDNLLNQQPRSISGVQGLTNYNLYDIVGRSFSVSVTAKY